MLRHIYIYGIIRSAMYIVSSVNGRHIIYKSISEANRDGIIPVSRLAWKYDNIVNVGDWLECDDGGVAQCLHVTKLHLTLPGQIVKRSSPIIWSIRREFLGICDIMGKEKSVLITQCDALELARQLTSGDKSAEVAAKDSLVRLAIASIIQGLDPDSRNYDRCLRAVKTMIGKQKGAQVIPELEYKQKSSGSNPPPQNPGSENPYNEEDGDDEST